MWPEYLGKFTFMGETRNQAPIYVKAVPNTWMERMNPPTLSREQDGKWYVQSPWETENGGTIFRCKTILFLWQRSLLMLMIALQLSILTPVQRTNLGLGWEREWDTGIVTKKNGLDINIWGLIVWTMDTEDMVSNRNHLQDNYTYIAAYRSQKFIQMFTIWKVLRICFMFQVFPEMFFYQDALNVG